MKKQDIDMGAGLDELEEFISKRTSNPLQKLKMQEVFKKVEQEKEKSYQELIIAIKGNPGMEHLDNLLGQIDIAQTYCESVCYLVGLTDGIRLRNIFDL